MTPFFFFFEQPAVVLLLTRSCVPNPPLSTSRNFAVFLRVSPVAVLAAVRAAIAATAEGRPPPPNKFTCFVCLGNCSCKVCRPRQRKVASPELKAARAKAREKAAAERREESEASALGDAAALGGDSAAARGGASATKRESSSKRTLDSTLESAAAEWRPGSASSTSAAAAAATARGCAVSTMGEPSSARTSASIPRRPFRTTMASSAAPMVVDGVEGDPNEADRPLDAMLTNDTPPANKCTAPAAPETESYRPAKRPAGGGILASLSCGDGPSAVTPPGAECPNVLLSLEDAALFPWMTPQESSPELTMDAAGGGMSASTGGLTDGTGSVSTASSLSLPQMGDVRGVSGAITAASTPAAGGSTSVNVATNVAATAAAAAVDGADGGAGVQVSPESQAVGGGRGRGYPSGLVAGLSGVSGPSAAGRWRSRTATSHASYSASMGRPGLSVSVAPLSAGSSPAVNVGVATVAGVSDAPASAQRRPPSALPITMIAAGAPALVVNAARRAEVCRQRATEAVKAARKLEELVLEAKAYSDRNNKAAMWRVEAATKLKDKLIMANELIAGYSNLRRTAEEEARNAAEGETAAVGRLRQAEASQEARSRREATANRIQHAAWNGNPTPASLAFATTSSAVSSAGVVSASNPTTMTSAGGFVTTPSYPSNGNGIGNVPSRVSMAGSSLTANGGGGGGDDGRPLANPSSLSSSAATQAFPWESSAGWWMLGDNAMERRQSAPTPQAAALSSNGGRASPSPPGILSAMPAGGSPILVENRKIAATAATSAARAKEATVVELAKRQKRAEAGRAELVRETQWASDAASKASAAAMHYEQVARAKRAEEKRALDTATRSQHEAEKAEWEARTMFAEFKKRGPSVFGAGAAGERRGGCGGSGAGEEWRGTGF